MAIIKQESLKEFKKSKKNSWSFLKKFNAFAKSNLMTLKQLPGN